MNTSTNGVLAHAISGGVDSSIAAYLLSKEWDRPEEGRQIVCVNHYVWPGSTCCNTTVIERAKKVCSRLGLPFYLIDMQERFRECVVDDFTRTYIEGKTPNPCVRCNEKMRFSDFYMRVRARLEEEGTIDTATPLFLSTGHYARIVYTSDGPFLKRARDSSKDQSYMLYRISKAMLPNLVFPLGEYTKKEVVGLARELDFPQASVRESQDVCFIDGEYGEFVKQYGGAPADVGPGEIVDSSGTVLGKHKGYIYYTVGQRRGLDLSNGPWYVKEIDPYRNRVVVGRRAETLRERFRIEETNWFIEPSAFPLECEVKIRYNTPPVRGYVELDGEQGGMITLATPCVITRGQSAVCYRDGLVLGGGIIA